MMGVGEVLMLIGMLALLAAPVERTLTHRRVAQSAPFEDALKRAFPFSPPCPPLDALVRQSEEALEQSDMVSGIIATAATYDHADDGAPSA